MLAMDVVDTLRHNQDLVTRELSENEALFSNRKIREVLGFKEEHDWRKYVKG
jgi:hypothetical protein